MSQKNKPCPFCGSNDIAMSDCYVEFNVCCNNCGAEGPYTASAEEAWEKWNNQKQLEEKDAIIDWLADMCKAFCENHHYCNDCINYPSGCPILSKIKNRYSKYEVSDWRQAAQEAVKNNDR